MEVKYDASYLLNGGKTKGYVVSPETVLGRKMTDEEIQRVLDDVKRINIQYYTRIEMEKIKKAKAE